MRILRFSVPFLAVVLGFAILADARIASASAPAAATASLHGTVINPSGQPLAQASVSAEGTAGARIATTNSRGEYTIAELAAGDYRIKVTTPGFDSFEVQVTLTAGENQEVSAVLRALPAPAPPPLETAQAETAPSQGESGPPKPAVGPAPTVAAAQNFSVTPPKDKAALYGIVTDQSGAVIQSGSATLVGPGGPVNVNANTRGEYVLNGLAPGTYKLKVIAPGFAAFETDLTLNANQAVEIDATLQPPSATTEVNVEAGGPSQVETETAEIAGTVTEKEVLKTGLNGRNFTQLIALAPGVSNQTGQDEAKVGVAGSVKYSVNGGRVEYNNFDVDGSDVLNAGLNGAESTLMVYPSLDAIQEVKVLTSNYGAEYGRSASGTVLVTTKSGTKDFHGVLYDFIRNEAFNARNYFDQTTKAPLYRRQDFGGAIGGPLYIPGVFNSDKSKTFFFWSEEFRLEKSPQDFNQAVPTAAERGVGVTNCATGPGTCGDFSDVCPFVNNGGTAVVNRGLFPDCPVSGTSGSNLLGFVNNQVPINPTSGFLLNNNLIPLPTSATGCNSSLVGTAINGRPNLPCYAAVVSPSTYWREELARVDHNFTSSLKASFRYIHDSWDTTVATPQWGYVENSFPTVQNRLNGPGTSLVARLTDAITPTLLNEFVVSYVNANISLANVTQPGVTLLPLPNCGGPNGGTSQPCQSYIFNNGGGGKPPGLVIGGTNAQYGGNGFTVDPSYVPWNHTNPTYSLADNVSLAIGKHTLQFGIQVVDAQRNETNGAIGAATGDLQGILTFSNQNNLGTNGNAFADFLAGPGLPGCSQGCSINAIKSYQQDSAQHKYYNDYWITEPYIQDDWHLSRRLTLNMGLRFSLFGNYHEKNLAAYNWVPTAYSADLASTARIAQVNGTNLNAGYLTDAKGVPIPFNQDDPLNNLSPIITNGLVQCGKNGVPSSCMTTHRFNPAPRIGFAWDPRGDGKTSIRGGYGVFFEHGTAKEANTGSLEGSSPLVLTMTDPFPFSYQNIGWGCSGKSCNNFVPVAFPLDVTSIPTKTVWPYVQQWSLSVERQLPKNMVGTVAYVGSKGTHLSAELQLNQLSPPPTGPDNGVVLNGNPYNAAQPISAADCSPIFPSNSTTPYFVVNGIQVNSSEPAWKNLVAACYGTTNPLTNSPLSGIPNPNTLRPYFGIQRILGLQNVADSAYNAFQTTLRRTRGPLTVGVSYTYSHSIDDSSDRSDASFVNSADIHSSRASSNFDQRHLLNVNYIYDLPKLSGAIDRWLGFHSSSGSSDDEGASPGDHEVQSDSTFLRALLDGWQISGITVFQSGTPFSIINGGSNLGISVLDNAGVANGAGAGSYPDIVGDPKSHLPVGVNRLDPQSLGPLLYNPAAFAAPQGLTFGNAGRNFLNNPHRTNFDMSVLKNFKITERSNLEFRAEAFNIFNHTQFRIFNPNLGNAANNTISCYGGGLGGPFTAAGGYTQIGSGAQPQFVNCTGGSSFLHPIDAHRPRTIQFGLKLSF